MSTRAERRRQERNGKSAAVIGWIYPDDVAGPFLSSVCRTMMDDANLDLKQRRFCRPEGGYLNISSGPMIVASRNRLVKEFLENFPQAQWLVTVDADMCWGQNHVHRLIDEAEAHDFGVLGGLCFAASRQIASLYPTIYVVEGLAEGTEMPKLKRVIDYPEDAIVECDATGAAFTAIHRDVLLAIFNRTRYMDMGDESTALNPHPWYAEIYTPTGGYYGEDLSFCLRARQEGAKIGVHTGIEIGHVKPRILGPREWKAQQAGPSAITE